MTLCPSKTRSLNPQFPESEADCKFEQRRDSSQEFAPEIFRLGAVSLAGSEVTTGATGARGLKGKMRQIASERYPHARWPGEY